jgi:hypothetical protein
MSRPFAAAVRALAAAAHRFDDEGHAAKRAALERAAALPLAATAALPRYYAALLFLFANPSDEALLARVEGEFARIAAWLRARRGAGLAHLEGDGLPFVDTVTRFSHDCVRWLLGHDGVRVGIDSWREPRASLGDVLRLTLPSLERGETSAGHGNHELLDALRVKPAERLGFVVGELSRFDDRPYAKDHLFDSLDLFVRVTPKDRRFSKAYNRLPVRSNFLQRELLRRFDPRGLMDRPLPPPRDLAGARRDEAIRVIKNTLALTQRETDPATYLDPGALTLVDLERGLTVAVYGMTPARQLPLEVYAGFTLFKNGLAVAYGGAWMLGRRANFGMNIFEPYRGGESGFMMCQVLRTYRQLFRVQFFEVDAHQFGLDNPDGIASGAYWFYWRHGFRSLDAALAALAEREREKMVRRPTYRSSEATLLRFTRSNVALDFGTAVPPLLADITERVTRVIARRWHGDRRAAEQEALALFEAKAGPLGALNADQRRVATEVGLIAAALDVADAPRLAGLREMIAAKPVDQFRYQGLLSAFLGEAVT